MEKESKRKKSPAKALKVIIKGKMVEGKKATARICPQLGKRVF